MTDNIVADDAERGNTSWTEAEERYRSASDALMDATTTARDASSDVDEAAVMNHAFAARALIETPATRIAHVAIKIRAADNLLALSNSYPELPRILLHDIFGLIGISDPEGLALPYRV